jgi:putative intracellular protease/amidase
VPFLLESTLWKLGAMLKTAEDFGVHVVRDRNLITGHDPARSAKAALMYWLLNRRFDAAR